MKQVIKIVATLTVLALLYGMLGILLVRAQGPDEEEIEVEISGEIGAAGLANPVPAGYSRVYMFTGVANDNTGTDQIATCVHCTNYGIDSTEVQVVLYNTNGAPYTGTHVIASNRTLTFASQSTVIFFEDVDIGAGFIYRGSGQVIATVPTIICAAQLVDPLHDQPVFMAKLPLISATSDIYVPNVLKN